MVWGWAVAQYPYLLPPWLTVAGGAAPAAAEAAELVVVGVIAVTVVPSFVLLFRLAQSGRLGGPEAAAASLPAGSPPPGDDSHPPRPGRLLSAVVLALVAVREVQRLRRAWAPRHR